EDQHGPGIHADSITFSELGGVLVGYGWAEIEGVDLDEPYGPGSGRGDGELDGFPPSIDQHEEVTVDEKSAVLGAVGVVASVQVDGEAASIGVVPVNRGHCRA